MESNPKRKHNDHGDTEETQEGENDIFEEDNVLSNDFNLSHVKKKIN